MADLTATSEGVACDRRSCWEAITTADGLTICGTLANGWFVVNQQGVKLAHLPDDGGPINALIRYRGQCYDAERAKERDGLRRQEDGKHDAQEH